jgi:serine/threonine protein kinase/phage FluMu protein Com
MLTIRCTRCNQLLQVADEMSGRRCKCSKCGTILEVPHSSATLVSVAGVGQQAGAAAGAGQKQAGAASGSPVAATVPPARGPGKAEPPAASSIDLSSYLTPAQGPDELGRVGTYRVVRLLGSGGMGVVLQAEDSKLRRSVALKIMQPTMAAVAEHRERFLQEARIAAAVEHDNIITIYQVDEERGLPYIAMQLLRGETLESRLQRNRGPQPIPFVIRVGREIAAGLQAAHEAGLIHRDIKPSNIWLEAGRDRVKILDFGLARVIQAGSQLTQAGVVLGTPGYLAPEQVGGQPVSTACDRFSLGAVLYRMCTGVLPFKGTDMLSLLAALATTTPTPVSEVNPDVPSLLADLITQLLLRDPNARPSDAEVLEILTALDFGSLPSATSSTATGMVDGSTAVPDEPTAIVPAPAPKPKSGFPVGVMIAAAGITGFFGLLLIGGVALIAFRGCSTKPETQAAQKEPEVKKPTVTDEALDFVEESIRRNQFAKGTPVGFPHGADFDETPRDGAILVGFEIGLGKFINTEVIQSIRPIYLTRKGELQGTLRAPGGQVGDRVLIVKAKPGYAVASIAVHSGIFLEGMRITYNRIAKDRLDASDSYQGDWIGHGQQGTTIGGHGVIPIGITGKSGHDGRCGALGLVTTFGRQDR